ncbi:hypothetical protein AYJ54_41090 [Bradyrhizobium centrolobii]|uniref:Uncharacterized protein n=1 Tax=Bradyrhizobium centrolobii TaxID=1505087 RepID=A0A176Z596_9BRAD|nr:hypothetical protein [Bradyrhizobium centrolobii]OAF15005.1 hypothetical protein AYJ54_41090 [Bradyrhizobium centrolobii]
MKQHTPEMLSIRALDWAQLIVMDKAMPPRDPDEDEDEDDEEDEEEEPADEPAVVREPDED